MQSIPIRPEFTIPFPGAAGAEAGAEEAEAAGEAAGAAVTVFREREEGEQP